MARSRGDRLHSPVGMFHATCWVADNGNAVIRRSTYFQWLLLVVCILVPVALLWGSVTEFDAGFEWVISAVYLFLTVLGIPSWIPALIPQSFTLDTVRRRLEIKRGRSVPRQIPFRRLFRTIVTTRKDPLGGTSVAWEIALLLDDGETIVLGTVSGLRAAQRSSIIVERVALATSTVIDNRMSRA